MVFGFIYHPRVIKFRLQVLHLFKKTCGMREAVDVGEEGTSKRKGGDDARYTLVVNSMLDDIADGIVGRQVNVR
jgi:hypothetical protein